MHMEHKYNFYAIIELAASQYSKIILLKVTSLRLLNVRMYMYPV